MPDEASLAKPRDGGGLKIEGVEWYPVRSFNSHATSMTGPVGHWLSKLKINLGGRIQRRGAVKRTAPPGLAKLTPLEAASPPAHDL